MEKYIFKPKKFYLLTLAVTWAFWIGAAVISHIAESERDPLYAAAMVLMFFGLMVPMVMAFIFVKKSGCMALKKDYKEKMTLWTGFPRRSAPRDDDRHCEEALADVAIQNDTRVHSRIRPLFLLSGILLFVAIIFASIAISLLFGESKDQFGLAEGFSFSIGGVPTLALIIITALFEELGWRGYAEDSIAQYHSWFMESIIFGILWGAWHLPLFFIEGTYQAMILQMNPWYMVNFFVGIMPLGFIFTWIYVGNNRSIFACSIFHFVVNFLQEQIAMTQNTKCIETVVMYVVAAVIVLCNKDMFFEKRHVGRILE